MNRKIIVKWEIFTLANFYTYIERVNSGIVEETRVSRENCFEMLIKKKKNFHTRVCSDWDWNLTLNDYYQKQRF